MPHFLAIAWMYREDYAGAGFVMLSNYDPEGFVTARQALLYSGCLLIASLTPALFFYVSAWYFFGALALGIAFCATALALSDPARPRFGSNTLSGVDPLSSFAPRVTCGRTPMNEEQAQFLAHAFSLAFCRRPLCNGGRFDAVARSGDCPVKTRSEIA